MSEKDEVFDYVMDSPQDTNPAVLRSLLNAIPEDGGGADLPAVTTSDNGYTLSVVNGAWDKKDPILRQWLVNGSSDKVMLVQEDVTPVFETEFVDVGGTIYTKIADDSYNHTVTFQCTYIDSYSQELKSRVFVIPSTLEQYQMVTVTEKAVTTLASPTSNDNGKVAIVSNGAWSMSDIKPLTPVIYTGTYVDDNGKIMFNSGDTPKQIYDAYAAGATVYLQVQDYETEVVDEWDRVLLQVTEIYQPGNSKIRFTGIYRKATATVYYKCLIDGNDSTTVIGSGIAATRYVVDDPT